MSDFHRGVHSKHAWNWAGGPTSLSCGCAHTILPSGVCRKRLEARSCTGLSGMRKAAQCRALCRWLGTRWGTSSNQYWMFVPHASPPTQASYTESSCESLQEVEVISLRCQSNKWIVSVLQDRTRNFIPLPLHSKSVTEIPQSFRSDSAILRKIKRNAIISRSTSPVPQPKKPCTWFRGCWMLGKCNYLPACSAVIWSVLSLQSFAIPRIFKMDLNRGTWPWQLRRNLDR